jgi:positive regulator of sigma E activity
MHYFLVFLLLLCPFLQTGHSAPPLVRAFTVLIGVILAFWVSSSRQKLQRQQTEIETIVNLMPIPWLPAD